MVEASAFAVKNNFRNSERNSNVKNPHLKCGTCNKIGHTSETCRSHLKCDYCGWQGHTIDVCRKLQKNSTGNKHDQREHKNVPSKANHANAATPVASNRYTLTAEQYHSLITLLNENKSNFMANHVGSTSAMSDVSGPTIGEDDWDGN
ncbi:uncharacterized protein LOC125370169 [Ricinus communis]|uniref:uncharacterized protein LOC125370169 n=1 Tax=Ricinus communis TaxID=3988 RepID=UPI00201A61A3|nr:uncharacterized protein LOC125370169 [Ricinus communis]